VPFQPPANLKDFDRSRFSNELYEAWDTRIRRSVTAQIASYPAFFNPFNPPATVDSTPATPEWTGLPRTMKRRFRGDVVKASQFVEEPISMGQNDPLYSQPITTAFMDIRTGEILQGQKYRPQDEYLEWVTRRDIEGNITEVIFTAEGPEYWDFISFDPDLLLALYRELVSPQVRLEDLYFDRDVSYMNGNQGGTVSYNRGDYNPYNAWNMLGAIHLTQPANTLGAEIQLAKAATRLYGDSAIIVTEDPQLVTCGGYGGINRMSDPTIGSTVNSAVRSGSSVSLRDPIGLYIKGIDPNAFALKDGTPISNINDYFVPIRPNPSNVVDMVVRARFRVPDGVLVDGRQAFVNDLLVDADPIQYGGQIADKITLRLFGLTAPGAPTQPLTPCSAKACPAPGNPDFIIPVNPTDPCPTVDTVIADVEPLSTVATRRGQMSMGGLSGMNRGGFAR
jgi:hypothetical protein